LYIPNSRLKYIQTVLLMLLVNKYKPRKIAHGYIKGKSVITNAAAHKGRKYMLSIDISNFFGSITKKRVRGLFLSLGLEQDVAEFISAVTTLRDALPQGAPTSPLISNMISYRLDIALMDYAKTKGVRVTRYADDITFSSFRPIDNLFIGRLPNPGAVELSELDPALISLFSRNGFKLNEKKCWYMGVKSRKNVTGLVINEFPNVNRKYIRNIRALLHSIDTKGYLLANNQFSSLRKPNSNPPNPNLLKYSLHGKINWVGQVKGRGDNVYRNYALRYNAIFPDHSLKIAPSEEDRINNGVWVIDRWDEPQTQGTAFFLEGVGLVTAYHVVKELSVFDELDIYLPLGKSKKFKAYKTNRFCEHKDLVVLSHNIPKADFLEFVLAKSVIKRESISVIGFPNHDAGEDTSIREGKIQNISTISAVKRIEVSAEIYEGMSGGPIINNEGKVVGVCYKGKPNSDKNLATHISELHNL